MTNEKQEVEIKDFDLPEVESTGELRVHNAGGDSACVACEG